MRPFHLRAAAATVLTLISLPALALECPANLTSVVVNDDLEVTGDCMLRGVTVNGSVTVIGGRLTTRYGTQIFGDLDANDAGSISLEDTAVLGSVSIFDSGKVNFTNSRLETVTIKRSGDVSIRGGDAGEIRLETSGNVEVVGDLMSRATLAALYAETSKAIRLDNAQVYPGGVSSVGGAGEVLICNSEIGIGEEAAEGRDAGVSVVESRGAVVIDGRACGPSQIQGTVFVEKGIGAVTVIGAMLNGGDVLVHQQAGVVHVEDTVLGGVALTSNRGAATLRKVTSSSSTTIARNSGPIRISDSKLADTVAITANGSISLSGNNFSSEQVSVINNAGPVVIEDNIDLSLVVVDNNEVSISGTSFDAAEISQNGGGVSILGNTGKRLTCKGNVPKPAVSGNRIEAGSEDQCSQG